MKATISNRMANKAKKSLPLIVRGRNATGEIIEGAIPAGELLTAVAFAERQCLAVGINQ